MSFWSELRRRHLIKIAIGYAAVGLAVVEAAVLFLPAMSVPDWTYNLVVTLVLIGFPIALVLGWALAMSPEGEVSRVQPQTAPVPETRPVPPEEPGERSVAVLPFANLSADPENEYFSDGITEEILTVLSRVRRLDVISRTSVMRYKGTAKGIREIARELGVANVVEGSVRRVGERVRITAQLIDARTDRHLWAETYDRDLDDIFAIQTDVAERIVKALQVTLTPAEREKLESRPTASVEAYQWYLKGRHSLAQRTEGALRRAIETFDRALEEDPGFALAWVGRAEGFALLPLYSEDPAVPAVAEARRSARRALEIQPNLAEARAALGLAAEVAWEWDEAERQLRRALELDSGYGPAHHWFGIGLAQRGRYEEAAGILERAIQLDPLSMPLRMGLGAAYFFGGEEEEAVRTWRRGLEIDPGSISSHANLAEVFEALGQWEEAIERWETVSRLDPSIVPRDVVEAMRTGLREGGATGYWEAKLEKLRGRESGSSRRLETTVALAQLGRVDEAMDEARGMASERHPNAVQIPHDPRLASLRSHPDYPALLRSLGLERMASPEPS